MGVAHMEHKTVVFTKGLVLFNRRLLIIKRSNYANYREGEWDLPGGGIEFGEAPLDCLSREIMEETGLIAQVGRLVFIRSEVHQASHFIGLVYQCNAESDIVKLSHEHTEFLWATKQQLHEFLQEDIWSEYKQNNVFEMLDID